MELENTSWIRLNSKARLVSERGLDLMYMSQNVEDDILLRGEDCEAPKTRVFILCIFLLDKQSSTTFHLGKEKKNFEKKKQGPNSA